MLDIPAIESWKVAGFNITEKYMVYVLALQMMMTNFPNSFVTGMCGIVAGYIYRSDMLKFNTILPPFFLVDFFTKNIYPHVNTPLVLHREQEQPRERNIPNMPRNIPGNLFQQVNQRVQRQLQPQQENIQQVERSTFTPNPQYVTMLVSMGFDRTEVIQALQYSNNNLERATEILIA